MVKYWPFPVYSKPRCHQHLNQNAPERLRSISIHLDKTSSAKGLEYSDFIIYEELCIVVQDISC